MIQLVVGARDLADVIVPLRETPAVVLNIDRLAELPASLVGTLSFSLTPAAAEAGAIAVSGARADREGRVTFRGVVPGEYWIGVHGLPEPWLLAAARVEGQAGRDGQDGQAAHDALDRPLQVGSGDGDRHVALRLTDRPGEIDGTFADESGRPATDYLVIVFPANPDLWRTGPRRIRAVRPATDGRFSVPQLPAGDYRLAAVWDAEPDEWFDPAFLSGLVPVSIPIAVGEGLRVTQNLRIGGR
jgi:hypothetical protein